MAAGKMYVSARSTRRPRKPNAKRYKAKRKNWIARPLYVARAGGIPNRLRTKLVWQGNAAGTINSATVKKEQIRLNSLYDPDFLNTLGNDQAQGRDRLADIYSNYYVRSVYVIFDVAVNAYMAEASGLGTVLVPATALVHRMLSWNGTSTFPTYTEGMPNATSTLIAPGNQKRIKRRYDLMKLQGSTSGNPLKNKDFGGVSGDSSTPANITWLGIEYEAPGAGAAVTLQYVLTVKLVYDVEYCNPKYITLDTN